MTPRDTILQGDCTNVMRRLASESVDFCLTDPPYLCNYRNRDGQSIRNDRTGEWLYPAFRHVHRLLKPNSSLRQLLRLAQGRRIHGGMAARRFPPGRPYRLPQAIRLQHALHGRDA